MENIETIREMVYSLGAKINAPMEKLFIPDSRTDTGKCHLEVHGDEYHYIATERGSECQRETTRDLDELLYFIFSHIAFSMASKYELAHRVENQDCRRIHFKHRVDLLQKLNDGWAERERQRLAEILGRVPFDDSILHNVLSA